MKSAQRTWLVGCLVCLLSCIIGGFSLYGAWQASSQYTVDRDVFNAGGKSGSSTTYLHVGSLGQSSPLGLSQNTLQINYGGFWGGGASSTKYYTLTVEKTGTGSGTVSGTGIACGSDCTEQYQDGAGVSLTATPDAGSTFTGWLVNGAPVTAPITVTQDITVTAIFTQDGSSTPTPTPGTTPTPANPTPTPTPTPITTPTPTPTPAHPFYLERYVIDGGGRTGISTTYQQHGSLGQSSALGLSENSSNNNHPGFWLGGEQGTPSTYHTLTIEKGGNGSGTVTGAGIACGDDCSEQYPEGVGILLTATPDAGSVFDRWLVDGAPATAPIVVTKNITVTAVFVQAGTITPTPTPATPPVSVNDTYSTNEDTTLQIPSPGVLANDSDPDNDPLSAELIQEPSHGTLTLNADGSFTYQPEAHFHGTDQFIYRATDGTFTSAVSAVTISVYSINDAPVAEDITVHALKNTQNPILLNGYDSDNDEITYQLVTGPTHGTLSGSDKQLVYSPETAFVGQDEFTYQVNDGTVDSNIATVTILVEYLDLAIGDINISDTVLDEDTFALSGQVAVSIYNIGAQEVNQSYDVQVYVKDTATQSIVELGTGNVSTPLAAGGVTTVNIPVSGTVPFKDAPIYAFVDSQNVIAECNETNNQTHHKMACRMPSGTPGSITPVLEWEWTGSSVLSAYNQVMSTPVVANLTDDNQDGVIDEHDIPDIIFNTFQGPNYDNSGVLRAIHGDGSGEIFTVQSINAILSPAVGDIDNDGLNEVVVIGASRKAVMAFDNTGQLKWSVSNTNFNFLSYEYISLADLEQDGYTEVIIGQTIINHDGTVRRIGPPDRFSIVADLDLDGTQEIIANRTAYRANGELFWQQTQLSGGGITAVGNFDSDAYPEVVYLANQTLSLLEHTGEIIWTANLRGTAWGQLLIVDVEQDGMPEIGVAGARYYMLYTADGTEKWYTSVYDNSRMGSSAFDFDGDGITEICHADENYLRIYRGTDGTVLYQTAIGSGSLSEYPLVVDVDRDNQAEIIVPSNSYFHGPKTGIQVFGDANNSWSNTRKIWNQHTYHITNVADDGSIPQFEEPSWKNENTYRCNPALCEDYSASMLRVETSSDSPAITLTARIGNSGGTDGATALHVAFYNGDPANGGTLLSTVTTTAPLNMGEYEDVTYTIEKPRPGDYTFYVVVDDDGSGTGYIRESDETNNTATSTPMTSYEYDLVITQLNTAGMNVDSTTREISGTVEVSIRNNGSSTVDKPFELQIYQDDKVQATHTVLGTQIISQQLAQGATITIQIPVSGQTIFKNNPIYAFVDSQNALTEFNEANNITHQKADCRMPSNNPGSITPVLEWEWTGSPVLPAYNQVMSTPVVANLTDDNQDGVIDDHDIPDIIFNTFKDFASLQNGILRAIHGDGSGEIFTIESHQTNPRVPPAVGDLDNDGLNEIVVIEFSNKEVLAFNHTGQLKWKASDTNFNFGLFDYISLADLEQDGYTEVIIGQTIINHDGTVRRIGPSDRFSIVADLNLDGTQEIIANRTAYQANGEQYWQQAQLPEGGMTAVGNFDSDAYPEVVYVAEQKLSLLEHTGEIIWVENLRSSSQGQLLIADMEQDGIPEIGVGGINHYMVYNANGTEKWYANVYDYSQKVGSTAFDLDGDGITEIIYEDENYLRIFKGTDGTVLYQTAIGSGTVLEYPLVVDVDRDNQAEIIVGSNDYYHGPKTGIQVFGDANHSWSNTRKIWNQQAYHVTNVEDDGSIPQFEEPSWRHENTYRCNPALCEDYSASELRVESTSGSSAVKLIARIGNSGATDGATTLSVAFYSGNPADGGTLLGTTTTTSPLDVGEYEDVTFTWTDPPEALTTVYAVVDDDGSGTGSIRESDETNNTSETTASTDEYDVEVTQVDTAGIEFDPATLQLSGTVSVTIRNNAAATGATDFMLKVYVEDIAQGTQTELGTQTISQPIAFNDTLTLDVAINGQTPYKGSPIYAFVDSQNVIAENNEDNNIAHNQADSQSQSEDYSISYLRAEKQQSSTSVDIIARVGNSGGTDGTTALSVAFYNGNPANGGTLLGTKMTTGSLDVGEYEDVTYTWTNPPTGTPPTVYVVVDDDGTGQGSIQESDETNNTASLTISIGENDLELIKIDTSDTEFDPETMQLSGTARVTIRNNGTPTGATAFMLTVYVDDIAQGTQVELGTQTISQPIAFNGLLTLDVAISGQILFKDSPIYAFVDSQNVITESNENNNIAHNHVDCQMTPVEPGSFSPVLEWEWTGSDIKPNHNQVVSMPVITTLNDDNGDGLVNDDDIPDILFLSYNHPYNMSNNAVIRAISGDGTGELFTITEYFAHPLSGLAAGDIDQDGFVEILVVEQFIEPYKKARILAFEHNGTFKWHSDYFSYTHTFNESGFVYSFAQGSFSIADLEHDGTPEIIFGSVVLNNDGSTKWIGANARGGHFSVVADLNLDGSLEVIDGDTAYKADGNVLWHNVSLSGVSQTGPDFHGIANFDSDPYPEIVLVTSGYVYLLEHDGEVKWGPVDIPPDGTSQDHGGAPVIADVDNDGQLEIGIAGGSNYVVLETDGSIKWTRSIQDTSSSTASSVFDFNGDGSAEICYADEFNFYIYQGTDGTILFQYPLGSITGYEYPLVADVDNDNNAEIIVTSNIYHSGQNKFGIKVFGDANDFWVNTRKIWNQHAYHVTNVNDDGTIPQHEINSWELYNTYRCNHAQNALACEDYSASYIRVDKSQGPASLDIIARVGNSGSIDAAIPLKVAFYNGNPTSGGTLLSSVTIPPLQVGEYEDVTYTWTNPPLFDSATVYIVVDDDGTGQGAIRESDETNNTASTIVQNEPPVITSEPQTQAVIKETVSQTTEQFDLNTWNVVSFVDKHEHPLPNWTVSPDGTVATQHDNAQPSFLLSPQNVSDVYVEGNFQVNTSGDNDYVGFTFGYQDLQHYYLFIWSQGYGYGMKVWMVDPAHDFYDANILFESPVFWEDYKTYKFILRQTNGLISIVIKDGENIVESILISDNTYPSGKFGFFNYSQSEVNYSGFQHKTIAEPGYVYDVEATDPDNDTLTYTLPIHPDGMIINPETGEIVWAPTEAQKGDHAVKVVVDDGRGGSDTQEFIVNVMKEFNHHPILTSVPTTCIIKDTQYWYDVAGIDPDDDPLTYTLVTGPDGMTLHPVTHTLTWTPDASDIGEYPIEIRLTDGKGGRDIQKYTLRVIASNEIPVITSMPVKLAAEGVEYTYDVEATDADGDTLSYKLLTGIPGINIDTNTGLITWTPTANQSGQHDVSIEVSDGKTGIVQHNFTLTVTDTLNGAPTVTSTPVTSGGEGIAYTYDVEATDAEGDPISYTLTTAPEGMTIDADTGLITWTPTGVQAGNRQVVVTVSDDQGNSTPHTFTIVVQDTINLAPEISSEPEYALTIGESYTYDVEATDPDGDALTFTLQTAPTGMTIDADTGLISWTPTTDQIGQHPVKIVITDARGAGASQSYTLYVNDTLNNAPQVASEPATFTGRVEQEYTYDFDATDADGDTLTYKLLKGPDGMSIDSTSGLLSWTPELGKDGTYSVTVGADDGRNGFCFQIFILTIKPPNVAPTVTLVSPADAYKLDEGKEVTLTADAADSDGEITRVEFFIDGSKVGEANAAPFSINWTGTGLDDHTVTAVAYDNDGASTTSDAVTITVLEPLPDTLSPVITVTAAPEHVQPGDTVTITLNITDDSDITDVILKVDGTPVTIVDNQAVITAQTTGFHEITVTATDAAGNTGTESTTFGVSDGSDTTPPTIDLHDDVEFNCIELKADLYDIVGSIADDSDVHYTLQTREKGVDVWDTLAEGTTQNFGGTLATFNPTMYRNGLHDVRLVAEDTAGNTATVEGCLLLTGRIKLGQTSIGNMDFSIPELGYPLATGRVYDSRNRHDGSFGPGWSMPHEAGNVQADFTYTPSEGWREDSKGGMPPTYYLVSETRKVLALRVGDGVFKFKMVVTPKTRLWVPFSYAMSPYPLNVSYEPVDNTKGTLETIGVDSEVFLVSGILKSGDMSDYNPTRFQLTLDDGTVYIFDKFKGLLSMTDPYGHAVTYSDNGISHSSGASLSFERDTSSRIERITDQLGRTIEYEYDDNGMLTKVTQKGDGPYSLKVLESYGYQQGVFEQPVLKDIIAPDGTRLGTYKYDSDGRKIGLIDHDGNEVVFGYDAPQHEHAITDRRGNPTTYVYDSDGNVTKVTDAYGNSETYKYDEHGRVKSTTNKLGFITAYTYDDDGNVLSETDPLGNSMTYTYDGKGNRLTATDPLGNTTEFTYDTHGKMLSKKDALGHVTLFSYDNHGSLKSTTDALNHKTSFTYDDQGNMLTQTNPLGHTVEFKYDLYGHVIEAKDASGNVTRKDYDGQGHVIKTINALGRETTMTYDHTGKVTTYTDAAGQITNNMFDPAGNLTSNTDAAGNVFSFGYDANENQTKTTSTVTTANGIETVELEKVYDKLNRITEQKDADGLSTKVEFDALGRQTATIDKLGNRTEIHYNALNMPTSQTAPNGEMTFTTYNKAGWMKTQKDANGKTVEYDYDAVGNVKKVTYSDGTFVQNDYDAVRRLIKTTSSTGLTTHREYDAAGNLIAETGVLNRTTHYEYTPDGKRRKMIDSNNNEFTYVYDSDGRQKEMLFPDGTKVTYKYNTQGKLIAETDQLGHTTQYEWNKLGLVKKLTNPLGHATRYEYNEIGNLISQTDANNHTTTFTYNKLGHRIGKTYPLEMSEATSYNFNSRTVTMKDFNGQTIVHEYNKLGQVVKTALPGGEEIRYTYTTSGQVETVTDSRGKTSYEYNGDGQLLKHTEPNGKSVSYTYNALGQKDSVTTPSGKTTYTYDTYGRLWKVTAPDNGVTIYTYDSDGNKEWVTYPNGVQANYGYDNLNRLTSVTNTLPDGTLISSYTYTLDAKGQRRKVEENTGRKVEYDYDGADRLIEEKITEPGGSVRLITYTYDPVGNRVRKDDNGVITEYQYDKNDRLKTDGTFTYTYDDNGNLRFKNGNGEQQTLTYNALNRLIKSETTTSQGSSAVTYQYAPDGIRVGKTVNGLEQIQYLVDTNRPYAQVLEEQRINGSSTQTTGYVYGDTLLSRTRNSQTDYYHYDGMGSVRAMSNAAATVTDTYIYDAYGQLLTHNGVSDSPYGYRGEHYDPELNAYYLRARYYQPGLGRFLTTDPLEGFSTSPLSLHRYIYGSSNPINNIDPSGEQSLLELETIVPVLLGNAAMAAGSNLPFIRDFYAALGEHVFPDAYILGFSFYLHRIKAVRKLVKVLTGMGPDYKYRYNQRDKETGGSFEVIFNISSAQIGGNFSVHHNYGKRKNANIPGSKSEIFKKDIFKGVYRGAAWNAWNVSEFSGFAASASISLKNSYFKGRKRIEVGAFFSLNPLAINKSPQGLVRSVWGVPIETDLSTNKGDGWLGGVNAAKALAINCSEEWIVGAAAVAASIGTNMWLAKQGEITIKRLWVDPSVWTQITAMKIHWNNAKPEFAASERQHLTRDKAGFPGSGPGLGLIIGAGALVGI